MAFIHGISMLGRAARKQKRRSARVWWHMAGDEGGVTEPPTEPLLHYTGHPNVKHSDNGFDAYRGGG